MADLPLKFGIAHRTRHFGSSLAAGAMMLSRMNRSEISRYDDLMADLSRLRTPAHVPPRDAATVAPRRRWKLWTAK